MYQIKESDYEIMIVDDNPENLRILGTMLKNEGYKVRVSKNGEQALESLATSEPDLLLLDVHMPKIDGFEVCRIIREDKQNRSLPIIFLSALSDTFNKVQAFGVGANDYITKPFSPEVVKARLLTSLIVRKLQKENDLLRMKLKDSGIDL